MNVVVHLNSENHFLCSDDFSPLINRIRDGYNGNPNMDIIESLQYLEA